MNPMHGESCCSRCGAISHSLFPAKKWRGRQVLPPPFTGSTSSPAGFCWVDSQGAVCRVLLLRRDLTMPYTAITIHTKFNATEGRAPLK